MFAGIRTAGFYSLFSKFNKAKGKDGDSGEGVVESLGEFTLDKSDKELQTLKDSWQKIYAGSETKNRIHTDGDTNLRYWVGRQFPDSEYDNGKRPLTDNVVFDSFETLIGQTTQQNPEPIVLTDDSPDMRALGDKVHMALEYVGNYNHLKTTLKKGVRHWGIRFVGVWKIGWDYEEGEIVYKAINPKNLILDANCAIENGDYRGEFLGEEMTDTAENLITRFPSKEKELRAECDDKLGSLMKYTQWWNDEFLFYTLKGITLGKAKNPNWNYDKEVEAIDENGQPVKQVIKGKNHWKRPKIPYVFMVVYDTGDEPADKTSLISQGLVTQDNINKSLKQWDRNIDKINGGVVVNGLMFNKEQSGQVAEAHRQGRTIVTPGKPTDAIYFPDNKPLPDVMFQRLQDQRSRFAQRFGVFGSTAEGVGQEETVRGKIVAGGKDDTRNGNITEYLELAAAKIYDATLQFIYVYYDTPHWVSVIGPNNAAQVAQISAVDFPEDRKLFVTVQNGSMVPQDELSSYNQAMAEWEGGVLDPLSYFEKTKDPNPQERAMKVFLWKSNPAQYAQQFLQVQAQVAQPPTEGQPVSKSGAPPASVPKPEPQPSAEQVEASQVIKSVPEPKI